MTLNYHPTHISRSYQYSTYLSYLSALGVRYYKKERHRNPLTFTFVVSFHSSTCIGCKCIVGLVIKKFAPRCLIPIFIGLFPFPHFYSYSHSHDIVIVTPIPVGILWDPNCSDSNALLYSQPPRPATSIMLPNVALCSAASIIGLPLW